MTVTNNQCAENRLFEYFDFAVDYILYRIRLICETRYQRLQCDFNLKKKEYKYKKNLILHLAYPNQNVLDFDRSIYFISQI